MKNEEPVEIVPPLHWSGRLMLLLLAAQGLRMLIAAFGG